MRMRVFSFRQARFDELGLRRALSDRMVPFLVAAMAFLAALAIAGWMGAAVLTRALGEPAPAPSSPCSCPIPRSLPPPARKLGWSRCRRCWRPHPGSNSADTLSDEQLNALLRPWLGADIKNLAIPVPAVIAVHMAPDAKDLTASGGAVGEGGTGYDCRGSGGMGRPAWHPGA